jgi:hypothetical protein
MKYLQIHLDKPCSENWDTMKPVEKGRFCAKCTKTVVDFTGMSKADMCIFLKKNQGKEICGRINPHQIKNPLPLPRPEPLRFAHAFMLATSLTLTNVTHAESLQLPNSGIIEGHALQKIQQIREKTSIDSSNMIVLNVKEPDEKCRIEITALGFKRQLFNGQVIFELPNKKRKRVTIQVRITFFDSRIHEVKNTIALNLNDRNIFVLKIEEIPMQGGMKTEIITIGNKKITRIKPQMASDIKRGFRTIYYPL